MPDHIVVVSNTYTGRNVGVYSIPVGEGGQGPHSNSEESYSLSPLLFNTALDPLMSRLNHSEGVK